MGWHEGVDSWWHFSLYARARLCRVVQKVLNWQYNVNDRCTGFVDSQLVPHLTE